MKTLQIFDPAMCCSTGVCGPSADPKLLNLAADVAFLKSQGVEVERFNLGHQPAAFASNPLVITEMGAEAENLPIFIVDGVVKAKGTYPDRQQLAAWFDLPASVEGEKSMVEVNMVSAKCCDSGEEGCC